MKPFAKHIVAMGRIVALSLFMSSAGFTTILHHCTMDSSECCAHSSPREQCETPMAPVPGQHSIQNEFQCHINTIAGGLSDIRASSERVIKQQPVELQLFLTVAPRDVSGSTLAPKFQSLTAYANSVSPPSVEKYVLISSFLI